MAATRWTDRGDGVSWSDPANWNAGVPEPGVDAIFASSHTGTVDLDGRSHPLSAGSLIVRGDTVSLAAGVLDLSPEPAQSGNTFDLVLGHGADLTVAATARVYGSNVAEIGDGTGASLTVFGLVSEEYGITRGGTLAVSGPKGHWLSGDSGLYFQDSAFLVDGGAHVDAGGTLAQYPAAALDLEGNSTGEVTGSGSTVRLQNVFLSATYGTGTLVVQDGGRIFTGGGDIGGSGDGTLTVTGAGSLFSANRGLRVGGQAPVNSKMVVENGGTVEIGRYGLLLDGTLALDSSATFVSNTVISGGGTIEALAGDVSLNSRLYLSDNDSAPFETKTTYLDAAPGATLTLNGAIDSVTPSDTSNVLDAASGHIVLAHSSGAFGGRTTIYGATLEIAARAAAGTGEHDFVGGGQPATLQIDSGLAFHNLIGGFGTADTIDLAGLSYQEGGVGLAWKPNAAGGVLRITSADHHQMLSFLGTDLSAASFSVMSDGHGGTALIHR